MSDVLADIRSALDEYGQAMVLRRRTGTTSAWVSVAVKGILRRYRPGELLGDLQQGDAQVVISDREIAAAGWPGPPRMNDQLVVDDRVWTVMGSMRRRLGDVVLAHEIWVRGG